MVDVIAVPDRFQKSIGKAQDHDVLNCLFDEIMVDAEDLSLVEMLPKNPVELSCGFQIGTKRLFDHDSAPMAALLAHKSGRPEFFYDTDERGCRNGKIEQVIAVRAGLPVNVVQQCAEAFVGFGIIKIAGQIFDSLRQPVPG